MQKNFLNTVEVTKRQRKVIVALRKCCRVIDQPFCFSSTLVYFSLWLSPKRTRAKIRVNGLPRRQYTTRITFREFQKKVWPVRSSRVQPHEADARVEKYLRNVYRFPNVDWYRTAKRHPLITKMWSTAAALSGVTILSQNGTMGILMSKDYSYFSKTAEICLNWSWGLVLDSPSLIKIHNFSWLFICFDHTKQTILP